VVEAVLISAFRVRHHESEIEEIDVYGYALFLSSRELNAEARYAELGMSG